MLPNKIKTSDVFENRISKNWTNLINRDDTIFETINYSLDSTNEFLKFKENNNDIYMFLVQESDTFLINKIIDQYFWESIVGELYDNTLKILNSIEESTVYESFNNKIKMENTARIILENGVFKNFNLISMDERQEIIESIITSYFYGDSEYLEESWLLRRIEGVTDGIVSIGSAIKSFIAIIIYILISPAGNIFQALSKTGNFLAEKIGFEHKKNMHPEMKKTGQFLDSIWPVMMIFQAATGKDLVKTSEYLQKLNLGDNPYLDATITGAGSDMSHIINKCWDKHKHPIDTKFDKNAPSSMSDFKFERTMDGIFDVFKNISKGLKNYVRNPIFNNTLQLSYILTMDATNPVYQRMFFDFRVCVYSKLFEIILGYGKTIYSMGDASYEIIKHGNDVHKNKNFKAFFNLKPKQENEEAMFNVMKSLVAIDNIAYEIRKNKSLLIADEYIEQFLTFLEQNIKQTYQQLDEIANLRKYNEDRYDKDELTDEEKAEKIKQNVFNNKRSIFDTAVRS